MRYNVYDTYIVVQYVPTDVDAGSAPAGAFDDGDFSAVAGGAFRRGASATASAQDEQVKVVS
jgi:hypothetical protein